MTRLKMAMGIAGFLACSAGAEAVGYVETYIYLQMQGSACRGFVVGNWIEKDSFVSNADDGLIWRIENLNCDEPAYVMIKADATGALQPLPGGCEGTYQVPGDVNLPPHCDFPYQPSSGGTYGYNVY